MNAVEIKSLTKVYDEFKLDNISFNIPTGSVVGLVGENGAGKSTTIKLIMNSLNKNNGEIKVFGIDNETTEFNAIKDKIGIVLDDCHFSDIFTAKDIDQIMQLTYKNWSSETYYKYLDELNISLTKCIKEYSRGMRMKLSIIIALSHSAKLLILDEATSGLDPMIRNEILEIFNEFTRNEENSILLSSHIVSDLEKICDYIVFIHKGKLIINSEKDSILDTYGILKISKDNLLGIPEDAIIYKRKDIYGYTLLVHKAEVSSHFIFEKATLEDIIILLSKEEN